MEIGDDLPNGETEVNLELEEALAFAKIGLLIVLYCDTYGVSTKEIPELIRLRGEYLKQEPEPSKKGVTERLTEYDTSMQGEWWE